MYIYYIYYIFYSNTLFPLAFYSIIINIYILIIIEIESREMGKWGVTKKYVVYVVNVYYVDYDN